MSSAGFLVYPTRFPEVGCITVMKAMSAGCIPITSRYLNSVLRPVTTVDVNSGDGITQKYDLGPSIPYSDDQDYSYWLAEHWVPAVIEAHLLARKNSAAILALRQNMLLYARRTFSWSSSALRLEKELLL